MEPSQIFNQPENKSVKKPPIPRLDLTPSDKYEGVKVGIKKNGLTYSVRDDRSR